MLFLIDLTDATSTLDYEKKRSVFTEEVNPGETKRPIPNKETSDDRPPATSKRPAALKIRKRISIDQCFNRYNRCNASTNVNLVTRTLDSLVLVQFEGQIDLVIARWRHE